MKKVLLMTFGIAAATLLIAGGGIALATHTDPNELHACYKDPGAGQMRFVSNPTDCKPGETAISWNQSCVQCPQGPTGPQGPAGVSGWQKVSNSVTPDTVGFAKTTTAVCPGGKQALGGGVRALGGGSRKIIGSYPTGSGNGWVGEVAKTVASDKLGLDVHVICASI